MRALLAIGVLVAAAAAPGTAAAAWHEQRLASAGAASSVAGPGLATNPRGDTAVAWRAGPRAYLAVRRAGRTRFGRRIALAPFSDPRVAVLSDGTVLVATLHNDGTERGRRPCCAAAYVQRLRPGARRLSARRLATVRGAGFGSLASSLVAGPGGRAALIGNTDQVELVTSLGRGVFRTPAWPSQGRHGYPIRAGFGGDGRGAALWVEGSNHEQRLRGAPVRRDGSVGRARTYVDTPDVRSDFAFFTFDAGLDRRSRLTALWVDTGGVGATPGSVSVASGTSTGPLRARQLLDSAPGIGSGVAEPDLAVAPDGRALATWRHYAGVTQAVRLAVRSAAGHRFRVMPAIPGGGGATQVALLSGGRGMLINGSGAGSSARAVSPGGALGAPRALRGALAPMGVSVVAAARRFTIAWGTTTGVRVATVRPG